MRTHPRISVAASAIVRFVRAGGWVGAAYPWYIKECRRLRGTECQGMWRIVHERMPDFERVRNDNFFRAYSAQSEEQA
jgi:hypothetical protein